MLDIVFENEKFARVRATKDILKIFEDRRILFGNRTPEQIGFLEIWKNAKFESYADYVGGRWLLGIGSFSYQASGIGRFKIGRYCSIAPNVQELGERHPIEHVTTSGFPYRSAQPALLKAWEEVMPADIKPVGPIAKQLDPPTLEHDVWIGQNALIARGRTLGIGSVVAAGAIVTKDVPPYAIVGGNPARLIKMRFPGRVTERLLASKWWDLHPRHVVQPDLRDPERFLDRIAGIDDRWEPKVLTWLQIADELG